MNIAIMTITNELPGYPLQGTGIFASGTVTSRNQINIASIPYQVTTGYFELLAP